MGQLLQTCSSMSVVMETWPGCLPRIDDRDNTCVPAWGGGTVARSAQIYCLPKMTFTVTIYSNNNGWGHLQLGWGFTHHFEISAWPMLGKVIRDDDLDVGSGIRACDMPMTCVAMIFKGFSLETQVYSPSLSLSLPRPTAFPKQTPFQPVKAETPSIAATYFWIQLEAGTWQNIMATKETTFNWHALRFPLTFWNQLPYVWKLCHRCRSG